MISHQELSAQQVCSYLMDFEDHFTSHSYRRLFWTYFENRLNREQPSPECYTSIANDENTQSLEGESDRNETDSSNNEATTDVENMSYDDEPDELDSDAAENDEVVIGTDEKGRVVARTDQVTDYCSRSLALTNLSLWDFVAQFDKRKNYYKKRRTFVHR
jgi:hypothetical protein